MISANSQSSFSPGVVQMLQEIFDECTDTPWFAKRPGDVEQFAKDLVSFYQSGLTDRDALLNFTRAHTDKHYARRKPTRTSKPEDGNIRH